MWPTWYDLELEKAINYVLFDPTGIFWGEERCKIQTPPTWRQQAELACFAM